MEKKSLIINSKGLISSVVFQGHKNDLPKYRIVLLFGIHLSMYVVWNFTVNRWNIIKIYHFTKNYSQKVKFYDILFQ